MEPSLRHELEGRGRSTLEDVRRLHERAQVNEQSNDHHMGTMSKLHTVTNVLKYVYLVLLLALLVLYAYERIPEHVEDRDWGSVAGFVAMGSFFVALPYYLMDAMLGARRAMGY